MTGVQPTPDWQHLLTWDEALGYEREDKLTIAHVLERECPKVKPNPSEPPNECPPALVRQAHEMLLQGRAQGTATLAGLTDLLKQLAPLHAPKHMVVLSGGLVFDTDLLLRYRSLAQQAAESHVALSIVHLDQDIDAADRGHFSNVFGGRDYSTGLGTVASMTGGIVLHGRRQLARGPGAFDRVATNITDFYELGVESRPDDDDGKAHKIDVAVARPGSSVRAPAATAVPKPVTGADALAAALAEPTDVAELPLEVATYTTHMRRCREGQRDRRGAAAAVGRDGAVRLGLRHHRRRQGRRRNEEYTSMRPRRSRGRRAPRSTSSRPLPSACRAVTADGRIGTLDLPIRVGLRQAGAALRHRSRCRQCRRGTAAAARTAAPGRKWHRYDRAEFAGATWRYRRGSATDPRRHR